MLGVRKYRVGSAEFPSDWRPARLVMAEEFQLGGPC